MKYLPRVTLHRCRESRFADVAGRCFFVVKASNRRASANDKESDEMSMLRINNRRRYDTASTAIARERCSVAQSRIQLTAIRCSRA